MHDSNQPAPRDGLAVQFMEFDGEVYDKESITMETLDKMIRFIMTAREASVFLSLDEYGEDGDSFVTADVENGWAAVAFNGWNEDGTPYMYQPVSQEGGAEEEADSLDSEKAGDAGQAGAAAAEAETIDDEPAPLGERRVAVEGLPVIWLAALAVLAAGLLLILLWRRKEKERKRRLADEMAAQAAADFLDREQR